MDRCALFVDAGYLLADGAMAVHGTRRRDAVSWDYSRLLELMNTLAIEHAQLPLLRCYWYEATAEGRRSPEHDALADVCGLKLRLGRVRPGRREGVDLMAYRDLTTLAREHAICDAVLVSGDEDMVHAVADAQELGVRVTGVHVAVDGNWTISRTLRQECDDLIEVDASQLRPYVNLLHGVDHSSAPLSNGQAHSGPIATHLQAPAGSGHRMRHAPSAHTGPQPMPSTSSGPPGASASPLSGQHRRHEHKQDPPPGQAREQEHHPGQDTSDLGGPRSHHTVEESQELPEAPPEYPSYGRSASHQSGRHQPPEIPAPQQPQPQHPQTSHQPQVPQAPQSPQPPQSQPPQYGAPPPHQDQSLGHLSQPAPHNSPPHYGQPPMHGQPSQFGPPSQQIQPQNQQLDHPSQYGAGQPPQQGPSTQGSPTLPEAVDAAHREGCEFGDSVARDAPALWLEAVLARKPRMPSDLEARLLQGSTLPIDFLLHDEVRHALRRGFWEALENSRRG